MISSFEEKSVWVQLISLALVVASYLIVAGTMIANGVMVLVPYVPVFAVAVVALVVVMAFGYIAAALSGKREKPDERDRQISWRAESNSSWVLASGVFFALCALVVQLQPVWVAHLLLSFWFASELLKLILQAVYYRRGV
jgi:uncharacterized membrane protein HdeD (DUF308 family)